MNMINRATLNKCPWVAQSFTLNARKQFQNGGPTIELRQMQGLLKKLPFKQILHEFHASGIIKKVRLGEHAWADILSQTMNYLWKETIHTQFFVDSINVIAKHSRLLAPNLNLVRLRLLHRQNVDSLLADGTVKREELGRNYEIFSQKTDQEKLEILVRLRVIELSPNTTLPKIEPPKQGDFFLK